MNRRQWISIIAISLAALVAGVLTSQWIYKTGLASDPAIKAFFANPGFNIASMSEYRMCVRYNWPILNKRSNFGL